MGDPPHVDGVSHRTVRARGLDFHVAEAGSGDDIVLCMHGWGGSGSARKEVWDPQTVAAFAGNLAEPARARARATVQMHASSSYASSDRSCAVATRAGA